MADIRQEDRQEVSNRMHKVVAPFESHESEGEAWGNAAKNVAYALAAELREAKEALGKAEEEIERLESMVMEDGRLLIASVNRDPAKGYYDEDAPYSFKAINDRCELARFFEYHNGSEHAE